MSQKFKKSNISKALLVLSIQAMAITGIVASLAGSHSVSAEATGNSYLFNPDYASFDETEEKAAELNIKLAAEGSVLLKNESNTLPLTAKKVAVLGTTGDSLCIGGAGSGGLHKPGGAKTPKQPVDIYESLTAAGFTANASLKEAYELKANDPKADDYNADARVEGGHYMEKVAAAGADTVEFDGSYYKSLAAGAENYTLDGVTPAADEIALVVLTRYGAEGADNKGTGLSNQVSENNHQMELDVSERELLAYAKKNYSKIVVVLNSPSAMQIGSLKDDEAINSIVWIGTPGWNGIMALGQILNGTVCPSGHTVDLYARDLRTDPTFYNFGDYTQANLIINGQRENAELGIDGKGAVGMTYDATYATDGVANTNSKVVDYAENIYVGYKYYETVYAELKAVDEAKANEWYNNAVVYPFGYGLSYTTFSQKISKISHTTINGSSKVEVTVKVTNTGKVAGKEVVQLYNEAPYTEDEIEKAAVAMVGFEKTNLLKPGESQEVVVSVDAKDLASFDYNDANENEFCGYELEKGTYTLSIRSNSHDVLDSKDVTVGSDVSWDNDDDKDTPNNIFSQTDNEWALFNSSSEAWTKNGTDHQLHRTDMVLENGTVALEEEWSNGNPNDLQKKLGWLVGDDVEDRTFKKEAFYYLGTQEGATSNGTAAHDFDNLLTSTVENDYQNLWAKTAADIPADWTQGAGEGLFYDIQLADMQGVDVNDPKWDEFMNQLTWEEIVSICQDGGFGAVAIDTIGKPHMESHDGPGQLRCQWNTTEDGNGWGWVAETVIASTYNKELAYQEGRMLGNESIFLGVSGWYGPGSNIHRSQLSGRNFEYYSSDAMQAGLILTEVVKGARSKGVHTVMKHLFLNDQETSRSGVATFANEQTIREIYAKPFEMAIKNGGANGYMTSFNRIGIQPSASYAIVDQMYIKEWGFDGIGLTDAYAGGSGWDSNFLIRGCTLPLNLRIAGFGAAYIDGEWDASLRNGKGGVKVDGAESATQWYWARETAKRTLHTYSTVNNMRGLYANNMLHPGTVGMVNGKEYNDYALFSNTEYSEFLNTMNTLFGSADKYDYEVSGLPAGVTFNKETGTISGKATTAGCYTVTFAVQGKGEVGKLTQASVDVTINVSETVKTGEVSVKTIGGVILNESNYDGTYNPHDSKWEWTWGMAWNDPAIQGKYISVEYLTEGMPEGLAMDPVTGQITGTLPANATGTYTIHVTQNVTLCVPAFFDSGLTCTEAHSYNYDVVLQVEGSKVEVASVASEKFGEGQVVNINYNNGEVTRVELANSVNGKEGEAVNVTLAKAQEGVTFEAAGLPTGLQLSADGKLTGTPTAAGTSEVTLTVKVGEKKTTIKLNVVIAAKEVVPPEPSSEATSETPASTPAETPSENPGEDTPAKKGCFGSVAATSALAGTLALAGAAVVLKKKKED